jgi:hypothetical protein
MANGLRGQKSDVNGGWSLQGLAAVRDLVEGLQLSKQFDIASHMLMMEISAMDARLTTCNGLFTAHVPSYCKLCMQ